MSGFINNVIKLTSSSIAVQIIAILLIPIISRFYGPKDYGIFQLVFSISNIITTISCFAYQLSIMLPKEDEDSANLFALCNGLIIAISLFSGLIIFIFSDWIGTILNVPMISDYLIFLPIIVFLQGLSLSLNYWLSRRARYGIIAASRMANALSGRIIQIFAGIAAPSPFGLIFGLIGGGFLADFIMVKQLKNEMTIFKKVSFEKVKKLAIRYKKFPLFTTWSLMTNELSLQVPVFVLAIFFTPVTVGYYSFANSVLHVPMSMIGGATAQVFYQKAAEEKNKIGSVRTIVREVYRRLISIGIFPMIVLMIVSEELFSIVFGSKWAVAGVYVKILIPWIFLVFISSPLSTLFSLLEKQHTGLSFNITLLISRFVVLYIGGRLGDPLVALILFSITGVLFWGWMNMYLLRISDIPYKEGLSLLMKYLLIALLISIPLFLVKFLSPPTYIILIVAVVCTLVYYCVIIFEDITLRKEIFTIIGKIKYDRRGKFIK